MNKNRLILKVFLGVLVSSVFFNSGCSSLQKKFIRKKKESKKEDFIPVLEPIEYEVSGTTVIEKYKYHLSMWKIWERDFVQIVEDEDINEKRQAYLLEQMTVQLNEMNKYIKAEKNDELTKHIASMNAIRNEFKKPLAMRNMQTLINKLKRIDKDIRNNYSAEDVEDYLNQ